jgi:hypothetical protein
VPPVQPSLAATSEVEEVLVALTQFEGDMSDAGMLEPREARVESWMSGPREARVESSVPRRARWMLVRQPTTG